jgi:hypothetical protein
MSATSEIVLVREKARRLGNGQLADEILRCRRGMQVAASRSAAARFERRLHVMQEEADRRMAAGGVS